MTISVALLSVTHERPEWLPWLYSQLRIQASEADNYEEKKIELRAFVVDSSSVPAPSNELVYVAHSTTGPGIALKRNAVMSYAARFWNPDYFAWFDDDDWSHPHRILDGVAMLEKNPECWAFGNRSAPMVNARTLQSWEHRSVEPVIFNGAVFRWPSGGEPCRFNEALTTGEDTDWVERYLKRHAYIVTPHPLHAWLCHGSNITNRADRHLFDRPFPENLSRFRATFETNPMRRK